MPKNLEYHGLQFLAIWGALDLGSTMYEFSLSIYIILVSLTCLIYRGYLVIIIVDGCFYATWDLQKPPYSTIRLLEHDTSKQC
jgi:hypothetical protein